MAHSGKDTYQTQQYDDLARLVAKGSAAVEKEAGGKWSPLRVSTCR